MNLTNKQKQYLKNLAHSRKPVVLLGNNGLTEAIIAEIELALEHHELIKVKISAEDRQTKRLIADAILRETRSSEIQFIGNIITLYRQSEKRQFKLPN